MSDYKYEMTDLVLSAAAQKPLEFEAAFNDLILDKIHTAVNDKKIAIAKQMYNYTDNEEELEDQEHGETA
jgi:hypothetical protein